MKFHPASGGQYTPLGFHGDDGQYNAAGDKLIVMTVNFLLARESPQTPSFGRFPLATLREFLSLGTDDSLQPLLRILAWSFNGLYTGLHPELDWNGEVYKGRHKPGTPISGRPPS